MSTWRTRSLLVVLTTGLAATVVGAGATPASASEKLRRAKARAVAIRAEVGRLEIAAEVATEDYNAARDELGTAVSASLTARRDLDDARRTLTRGGNALDGRVRALYESGGSFVLYASLLDARDVQDAFDRYAKLNAVVVSDRAAVDSASMAAGNADQAERRLHDIASRQTRIEQRVAAAAERVTTALRREHALLASADADVLRIIDEDRRAAEAAAAASFAARLAAARGFGGDPASVLAALRADTTQPVSAAAAGAIAAARSQIGKPYQWGATGPATFDCSGLTGWAYARAGVHLPRTSRQQWFAGPHPDIGALLPGDLLFWGSDLSNPQSIHHEALYIGGGYMIAAPHTGAFVRIEPVYGSGFFGATRPAAPAPGLDTPTPIP